MFPRKVSKFHKSSFPWCHDRPRTAKLGMNFTWIPPPSTSHGQVNSGEKKLCRSTGSLKETRSRATQEPTSPSSFLFLSFCPSPLDALRFYFRVLEPKSPRATRNCDEPLPWSLRHPRGAPKPRSMPKGARREQIKGFPSCRQVKKFFLWWPSFGAV